jgi:signal transduction histidine kinase
MTPRTKGTRTAVGGDGARRAEVQRRPARTPADATGAAPSVPPDPRGAALDRAIGTAEAFLLAEAGRQFAASLDLDETLRSIGQLVVDWMADWCIVGVLGPDGRLPHSSVGAARFTSADPTDKLREISLDPDRQALLAEALNSRTPVLVTDPGDEQLDGPAQSSGQLELLRAMQLRSYIAVPLITFGELVGGMLIGCRHGVLGARELVIATEVGRLAALAIRNARSYQTSREALRLRDDRLAMVVHDLRTPLSNAVLAAGLLRLRLREAGIGELDRFLDLIEGSANHMALLLGDLTDVVGLQSGRLSMVRRPLSAAALVGEVMDSFAAPAEAAGIQLSTDAPESCGNVAADRTRILQVFSNLVGNALKFTAAGGSVRITARPDGGTVLFSVADTGIGISAEVLARIFEPFWRGSERKDRGLGLGLTIARDIVRMHGGRIWAESQPGRGTSVHFSLEVA